MDLIDVRQLRAFQTLARTGSFTVAAKELFLTQSAISHSIKALEDSLDQRLLDRAGKSIALTAEGEVLLTHADRILDEMVLATEELKAMSQWGYGRLRLGATDTMCQHLLPPVLREFRETFPNYELSIHSADTEELLEMLSRGDIDLAIGIQSGMSPAGCVESPLFEDELVFAVPPNHPWAKKGSAPTDAEDLALECYLIYGHRSPTYRLVARYFNEHGAHKPRKMELGNMEAIRELAKTGLGVGVLARWVIAADLENGSLVAIQPPGNLSLHRHWVTFVRNGGEGQRVLATDIFLGTCRTVARRLEEDFSDNDQNESALEKVS